MSHPSISPEFPFESRYVEVYGARMHYIEAGEGDPILFLHGNPTWSYLWRNVIPHLRSHGRCIAVDLIGFGKSDKPDIAYRFFDHARFVEGFIAALGLENLTLVIHDWGSALGFHYARRHEEKVKGLAFMEAILAPTRWKDFPREFRLTFKLFRTRGIGWFLIGVMNVFINQILPKATLRRLSREEMQQYRAPFPTVRSRKPVWRWPNEIPIDGYPEDVTEAVEQYHRWLQETDLPKLLLYATPGGIVSHRTVEWCREHLKNLHSVDIGRGIHYLQEDNPHGIGEAVAKWYRQL